MKDVLKAIADRSSTRAYTEEKLTEEELEILINAGLQAPTAANKQEIHFTVIKGDHPVLKEIQDELEKERKANGHNFHYEAPVVFILSGDSSFHWSGVDAGIAAQNLALAAEGLGLGSLIIGCIRNVMTGEKMAYFNQALQIPEGYVYEIAVAVGHKAAEKIPHLYSAVKNVTCL